MTNPFKSFFYILALATMPCSAQWNDSFEDSDFRKNKSWHGDTSEFEINAAMQLRLTAPPVSGSSYLVTESNISTEATWKFWMRMDFNPSASNYTKIYLISNDPKIDSTLNGYYLKLGGTNDNISLFRQDGTISAPIIEGRNGMLAASVNTLSVLVSRNSSGDWTIQCDTTGQMNYAEIGQGRDTIYYESAYFGIQCIYTATRSSHFLFNDFEVSGKQFKDTIPPRVKEITALEDSLIRVEFTEPINQTSLDDESHYNFSPGFTIKNLVITSSKSIELNISAPVQCKTKLNISISKVADNSGNAIRDTSLQIANCTGDVYNLLITEIMADPDPAVYLPNQEYLELYNASESILNLENWKLNIGNDKIILPRVSLPPDSFLIITSNGGCKAFGKRFCYELLSTSILNNSGEYIGLKNKNGKLVHWINYDETYYHDNLKANGGWSLEMMDINSPCAGRENWKASHDNKGGTPGMRNSHNESFGDSRVFQYNHIYLPNDSTIRVYFSKPVDNESITISRFTLNPFNKAPKEVFADSLQQLYVDIISPEVFQPNIIYELQLSPEIADCSGGLIGEISPISFSMPSLIAPKDIIINEVMFDVLPGNQEFIEIYNHSNKYINNTDVKFAYKSSTSTYESVNTIGGYPFIIAPKSFLVLVKNSEEIELSYPIPDQRWVITTPAFPALNNQEGCIALINKSLEVLDEFCYSDKMHFPLIINKTGVSLERTDYTKPTLDASNWHSAASTEEYSTPGKVNSQLLDKINTENEITLEHEIFSPDNDGYKDYQTISYHFETPGYVANIIVFDAIGRKVKIVANNQLLGTSGSFTWDGVNQEGELADTGIYLIYIKLHHPSGDVKEYKKTCVLGSELKH